MTTIRELDEQYGREMVEPVIDYVTQATGIEWLGIGEALDHGTRYISNVKMRTWQGPLAGVYALVYIAEIAKARGMQGRPELRPAYEAMTAVVAWARDADDQEKASEVHEMIDHVMKLGETEGHPAESR